MSDASPRVDGGLAGRLLQADQQHGIAGATPSAPAGSRPPSSAVRALLIRITAYTFCSQHDHQAGEDEVERGAEADSQEQAGHEQRRFPSSPGWAHDQEHNPAPGRGLRYARFISAQWP